MKKFLPLIIIIIIAVVFAILALNSSKIIEGLDNKVDCEIELGEWGPCSNGHPSKRSRTVTGIKVPAANGGKECSAAVGDIIEQSCQTSSNTRNKAEDCSNPDNIIGYEWSSAEYKKGDSFALTGLKCSNDYYGTPTSSVCDAEDTPFTLSGCNKITAKVETANPNHIIVDFGSDIEIKGNTSDLKNGFMYKLNTDSNFKAVSNVTVTSGKQIKIQVPKNISHSESASIKYSQNKSIDNAGAELHIGGIKYDSIDSISVINNIVDIISPTMKTIVIYHKQPNKIIASFDEPIKVERINKSDFHVEIDGTLTTPSKVEIPASPNNNKLEITLQRPIKKNEYVTFKYIKNTQDFSLSEDGIETNQHHVKDLNNNALASIGNNGDVYVTNNVGYPSRSSTQSSSSSNKLSWWSQMFKNTFDRRQGDNNDGEERDGGSPGTATDKWWDEKSSQEFDHKYSSNYDIDEFLKTQPDGYRKKYEDTNEDGKEQIKKMFSKLLFQRAYNSGRDAGLSYNYSDSRYNNEYVHSMGAHNPFDFLNTDGKLNCKIDPSNKNKAICDLGRNYPLQHFSVDDMRDNRNGANDKYILKTKIVPVVRPPQHSCNDDGCTFESAMTHEKVEEKKKKKEEENSKPSLLKLSDDLNISNPEQLSKSMSKLFDVQEKLKLDNHNRSIKKKNGLKLNKNLEMPSLNPNIKTQMKQSVRDASSLINMDADVRFTNENIPTQLTHEMGNVKTNSTVNTYLPRLTSFSAF